MRRRLTILSMVTLLAVGLLGATACASGDQDDSTLAGGVASATSLAPGSDAGAEAVTAHASWELVARAGTAWIGDADPEHLESARPLRLSGVDPEVVAFTDRPERRQGAMTVEEVLALWHRGAFGQDPPNAAIATDAGTWAVELAAAVWDPGEGALVFAVRGLDQVDGAPVADLPTGELGPVTLFIDAVTVNSQITDAVTQTNVKVVAEAPAQAMGIVYQTLTRATGLEMENAEASEAMLQTLYVPDPTGDGSSPPPGSGITGTEWGGLIGP